MLRLRRVKTFRAEVTKKAELAKKPTRLNTDDQPVLELISLGELVLAVCGHRTVRVYGRDTTRIVRGVFRKHEERIYWLEGLGDNLVVSAERGGQIFTWHPFTMETIGSWKDDEECYFPVVAKLDDEQMVISSGKGDLVVLSHSCGSNLKMNRRIKTKHKTWIKNIVVSHNLLVSCSHDKTANIFDKRTFNHLATLRAEYNLNDVAVSETHIVMVCDDGCIYVYRNTPPYALDFILQTPYWNLKSLTCLNADIVAVSGDNWVYFISLSKKSFAAQVQVSRGKVNCFAVLGGYRHQLAILSDNRIALVHDNVCSLFRPPQQVELAVIEYTTNAYGKDATLSGRTHPILDAWNSVQQKSLSVVDACKTVIKSENTTRSLDEWCVAHNLLMQAANTGAIPRSRDYNGTKLHWHLELYRHCDELAIGEKDVTILISLFREAEDAGVIAEGTSELFVSALDIRKDIDKDKWYTANAIYELFLRQAKADATLKQVLHYQNVQQITSMVNAILGFVPIGGSMATNVISGGAAILNDFQVCGLVESLMGVGKDMSGGFGSDKLVKMFVRRGNAVLSEEHWNEWGEGNRKAVEDAARNMGLTVDELREKLLRAAEMMNAGQESEEEENATEVVDVEEGEDGCMERRTLTTEAVNSPALVASKVEIARLEDTLLESVHEMRQRENEADVGMRGRVNRRHSRAHGQASTTKITDAPEHVVSKAETSEQTVNLEVARLELTKWENEPLNQSSVEELKDGEAASCLAAFLVAYNKRHVGSYIRLKDALLDVFFAKFIDGSSFVRATGIQRENLIKAGMSAIEVVTKGDAIGFLGIRLELFLEQVVKP